MGYLEHIRKLAIGELFRGIGATRTKLRLDLNHSIGALRTPDVGGGGTLEHIDALDVFRVEVDEFCTLLLIGGREVEILDVDFPYVAIDDDEGFAGAFGPRHTTRAPGGAGGCLLHVFVTLWRSHHHEVEMLQPLIFRDVQHGGVDGAIDAFVIGGDPHEAIAQVIAFDTHLERVGIEVHAFVQSDGIEAHAP